MAVGVELVRFGLFELDLAQGLLTKEGRRVKLQEQPFRMLCLLLEHPGQTVTREQLKEALWTAETFVDFDRSLNAAMAKLRLALGDAADNPRFIETQARRGYRFIAPVQHAVERAAPAAGKEVPEPRTEVRRIVRIATVAIPVLLIGAVLVYNQLHREKAKAFPDDLPPPVPLTSDPGYQWGPSFSPEGSRIAYAWNEAGKRPMNIYWKLIGSPNFVRLTMGEGNDFAPAWSPDGRTIAFLRSRDAISAEVMMISSVGGPERELARLPLDATTIFVRRGWMQPSPYLTWSPDGKWLLSLEQRGSDALQIVRISVESGERTALKLFPNPPHEFTQGNLAMASGDAGPSLSPDGHTLAFAHTVSLPDSSLFVVNVSEEMLPTGPPRSLHFEHGLCGGIGWTRDGQNLVVSSSRRGAMELWVVPVNPKDAPARLDVKADHPIEVAISPTSGRLVFSEYAGDEDLWHADLRHADRISVAPFLESTRYEGRPSYSPNGKQIAFESDRTGDEEIWAANADGSELRQVTTLGKGWAGSPAWSPDSSRIAFDRDVGGKWDVYVMPAQGGKPIRFTAGSASNIRPTWSHDGRWIYYCSSDSSGPQIWKKLVAGGPETQVTKNNGCNPAESSDGASLYYTKADESALWRIPTKGGEERMLLAAKGKLSFTLGKQGAYIFDSSAPTALNYLTFGTGKLTLFGVMPEPLYDGLTVSPDELSMVFERSTLDGSHLMLVDKFR